MKLLHLLPLVAASSSLVLPPESVLRQIEAEQDAEPLRWYNQPMGDKNQMLTELQEEAKTEFEQMRSEYNEMRKALSEKASEGKTTVVEWTGKELEFIESLMSEKKDEAEDWMSETYDEWKTKAEEFDVEDYLPDDYEEYFEAFDHHHDHPPHHGDDDDDHPHHPPHHGPPHHGPPHHGPPDTTNYTIYQLIANSEYSTTLAKLIGKYPEIVSRLNSTKHNHTVFAPTDKAFEKIPKHVLDKFSKKEVEGLLNYHIVPGLYSAKRLLFTQTAPTYLTSEHLAAKTRPQRLSFQKGFRGLSIDFYARVVAPNIFGSNGVVHGIDSPIFPPIGAIEEITLFPGTFSTLELALTKTGLLDELNSTDHEGGTLFAPNNWAFEKLGPRINAFLFSEKGRKYLKALLLYHVVPDNTLYSDAYYHGKSDDSDSDDDEETSRNLHIDLPTALEDKTLAVDISSWGPIVTVKVNGFNRVAVADAVAEDGVIHVMSSVLIPPRKPSSVEEGIENIEEMTLEELVDRLEPYVNVAEPIKMDL